jgi:hypothetical protein
MRYPSNFTKASNGIPRSPGSECFRESQRGLVWGIGERTVVGDGVYQPADLAVRVGRSHAARDNVHSWAGKQIALILRCP